MITKPCKKLSALTLLVLSNIAVSQTTPLVAEDGVAFGTGNEDPLLRKGTTNTKDLQLDVGAGGVFSMFSGLDVLPTFKAGEGNSATVTTGKWYRIAKSNTSANGLRTNALFSLRDSITGGYNSNITFRTGMSDGDKGNMSFTLLSNSSFTNPVFSEVRYLSATNTDEHYLEVKVVASGAVSYSIMENLAEGAWQPIDWVETTAIPSGYTETKYDLNNLFMVAGETSILNIDRSAGVAIDGDLTVNGSPVITADSLSTQFSGPLAFGDAIALGGGSFAGGSFSQAIGVNSIAFGEWNTAYGKNSTAFGIATAAYGENSTTFGFDTSAFSDNSSAFGYSTVAGGVNSAAFGEFTIANGNNSLASGYGSIANGNNSSAFGYANETHGNNSAAFGSESYTFAENSFSFGESTIMSQIAGFAIGRYNEDKGVYTWGYGMINQWTGDNETSVFEIGIGADSANRKNAMTVMQDGTIELGKDAVTNEIPLKVNSDSSVIFSGDVILEKAQGDISMGIFGQ
jgi:hypothetical protein